MPTPMMSQQATNAGRDGETASPICPTPIMTALKASTRRPPSRSMARPTRGETKAATRSPSERPPTTQDSGQPVSAATGSARTAGR